jgi:fumarate reductase subunit C
MKTIDALAMMSVIILVCLVLILILFLLVCKLHDVYLAHKGSFIKFLCKQVITIIVIIILALLVLRGAELWFNIIKS